MEGSCTWTLVWPAPVSGRSDWACHPRGYSGFQVTGMIEWGQKSKPKKIPGPNFNPQKSHAKFLSHKNFWKAETVAKQVWFYTLFAKVTWPGIWGNYHESSDCFQYSQKFLLKSGYSSYPKNTFQNCPTKKNPKINNFKPPKIPQSSLLLEIWSTVCTPTSSPPPPVFHYSLYAQGRQLSLLQTEAMFKIAWDLPV